MNLREILNGTTIADRLLLFLLLIASLTGIVFIKDVLPKGNDVVIEVNGEEKYRYALNEDRSAKIESIYGSLIIEIKNKRVRAIEASCSNKLCEKQGWIDAGAIICLPNRITVTVGSGHKSKDRNIDAITG